MLDDDFCEEEEQEEEPVPSEVWKGLCLYERYYNFVQHIQSKGFTYVSSGSFRQVYQREDKVIKIPRYHDGLIDNMVEARAYKKYRNSPTPEGLVLTPCRLLHNGCLMMMFVKRWDLYNRPKWSKKIDGGQVGLYKGKYVAFDYALEMYERFEWEREWNQYSVFFNSRDWEDQTKNERIREYLRHQRIGKLVA
jgi:hypothetical protein